MDWLSAAWVGVLGGASMEALDIIRSVRWHRQMPWNVQSDTIDPPQRSVDVRPGEENLPAPGRLAYGVAAVLRLLVSGAVSGVVAATYPPTAVPLVMYLVGLGALSTIERLTKFAPLLVTALAKEGGAAALESVQQPQQPAAAPLQGHLPGQQTSSPSVGVPPPDPTLAAQPNATGTGGVA
ncbi:hypothetical protein ACWDBD_00660 [Streptomyces sp. NPDC001118]